MCLLADIMTYLTNLNVTQKGFIKLFNSFSWR